MIHTDFKPSRSFADPHFSEDRFATQVLAIVAGNDSLTLSLFDSTDNTVVFTEEHIFQSVRSSFQLAVEFDRICSAPRYKKQFQKVILGYADLRCTLIPDSLYDSEKKSAYYQFSFEASEGGDIREDRLINLRARNVYALPGNLEEKIRSLYPAVVVVHAYSALIDALVLQYRHSTGDTVILHVHYTHFEFLSLKDGTLRFFNSFNYTTSEDLVYYTLFVFEQLGLATASTPVIIYGELDQGAAPFELLQNYLGQTIFGKRNKLLKYSTAMNAVPSQHYFNLYSLYLCAS